MTKKSQDEDTIWAKEFIPEGLQNGPIRGGSALISVLENSFERTVLVVGALRKCSFVLQFCQNTLLLSSFTDGAEFSFLDLSARKVIFRDEPLRLVDFCVSSIHHVIDSFFLFVRLEPTLPVPSKSLPIGWFRGFYRETSFEFEHRFRSRDMLNTSDANRLQSWINVDFQILSKSAEEKISDSFVFQLGNELFLLIVFTRLEVAHRLIPGPGHVRQNHSLVRWTGSISEFDPNRVFVHWLLGRTHKKVSGAAALLVQYCFRRIPQNEHSSTIVQPAN